MNHRLTEGCLGCRCLAEGNRAQGHSEGCRTQLEAEIAKTEDGRARLTTTTACLRNLARDKGREPDARAGAPTAVPVPPRPDGVQDEPMDAREASRKRRAEDAGHEADDASRGGAQPDPGSMVDDSMPELRRGAEALGADAVALTEAYSSTSRQRAGAFGLSAGVAMDLRLGWDLGQRADQVKAEKRLSDEKPHLLIFESHVPVSIYLDCNTPSQTSWQNCGSRVNVIWSLHAVKQDCKSSEVDAFSLSLPSRRRRSRACGS